MTAMIEVREAEESDRDTLWSFHEALYVAHRDQVVPPKDLPLVGYDDYEQVLRNDLDNVLRDRASVVLIAESAGVAAGYITGRITVEPRRTLPKRGIVEDWLVLPKWRRSGVGRKLLEALEEHFAKAGCEVMESATWSANEAARRAHEALGFQEIRVLYRKRLSALGWDDRGGD